MEHSNPHVKIIFHAEQGGRCGKDYYPTAAGDFLSRHCVPRVSPREKEWVSDFLEAHFTDQGLRKIGIQVSRDPQFRIVDTIHIYQIYLVRIIYIIIN